MQANSPSDSNDKVHVVLKRAKPPKHNEEHVEPTPDIHQEKEVKNLQEFPVQDKEPKLKVQTTRRVQEIDEADSVSSSEPHFDGDEEPLDDFTYDANSF